MVRSQRCPVQRVHSVMCLGHERSLSASSALLEPTVWSAATRRPRVPPSSSAPRDQRNRQHAQQAPIVHRQLPSQLYAPKEPSVLVAPISRQFALPSITAHETQAIPWPALLATSLSGIAHLALVSLSVPCANCVQAGSLRTHRLTQSVICALPGSCARVARRRHDPRQSPWMAVLHAPAGLSVHKAQLCRFCVRQGHTIREIEHGRLIRVWPALPDRSQPSLALLSVSSALGHRPHRRDRPAATALDGIVSSSPQMGSVFALRSMSTLMSSLHAAAKKMEPKTVSRSCMTTA